jgi:diaminohydroxyphosphoribosylaminopyrimidine deaminase/5-amino-6-(5-phosphoribosylamino)uracil reductase
MHRCLELAALGRSKVAPNPMVGALLVYEDRIIGEGYHKQYGQAHAEVNCIGSVKEEDLHLMQNSTLYVSLEPCAHFGKTPPCADLIIQKKIPKVVVGCRDPFVQVDGKGIEKLRKANVEVEVGVLEEECKELNKRFLTFHTEHRPYIILKWAQSSNGKIANSDSSRLMISNEYSNRLVHKWRSEEMAIMVGTNTAMMDDPALTTRLWPGANPIRLVVDMELKLPKTLQLFDSKTTTIVFNLHQHTIPGNMKGLNLKNMGLAYYQVTSDVSLVHQVCNALYQLNVQSVLVEGGAFLLQSFIDENMWDEARVITNEEMIIDNGLPAPILKQYELKQNEKFGADSINYFNRKLSEP